ncbi:MAG TPA: serine hydrolase domain-containing protein [Ignavibacteria bacterium]|nr:serine hydrolase domain-containing protein [Ignavibacteria bacterium]
MKKLFLTIVILFFSISVVSAQTLTDKIDAVADSVMANTNLPGMIISVVCGDFTYEKARGYADVMNQQPMTLGKTYRIGSVTKTFTITALLQLVDEGKLKLDDPISKFFPDFPNGDNITVRMLANMTSGIYNFTETEEFNDTLENRPLKKWTEEDALELAIKYPPYFAPGTDFHYSNTNTIMIGMIIEKLTGNSLADEINKRIIAPLGLKNTVIPTNQYIPGDYSHGYNAGDSLVLPYDDNTTKYDPSWAGAAGDIISNIEDIKVYIKALGSGSMISKEMQNERLKWAASLMGGQMGYGLGIFKVRDNYYGHNGGIPGFTNLSVYSPEKNCSVIVMYNVQISNLSPDRLALRIIDIMNGQ